MTNHASAAKMHRRDKVARLRNKSQLSEMKTYRKKFLAAAAAGNADQELFKKAQSLVAKAARKHVIPKNRASRIIGHMMKRMQSTA
jgi:small subunit ribosomal protein S20